MTFSSAADSPISEANLTKLEIVQLVRGIHEDDLDVRSSTVILSRQNRIFRTTALKEPFLSLAEATVVENNRTVRILHRLTLLEQGMTLGIVDDATNDIIFRIPDLSIRSNQGISDESRTGGLACRLAGLLRSSGKRIDSGRL
jgi:shikimate kinase